MASGRQHDPGAGSALSAVKSLQRKGELACRNKKKMADEKMLFRCNLLWSKEQIFQVNERLKL